MKNDIVYVTCYGKREKYKRQDAIDFYLKAMRCSEGSERERYTNVYLGLLDGLTEVSDLD